MTRDQFNRKNNFMQELYDAMKKNSVFIGVDRDGCICVYDDCKTGDLASLPKGCERLFRGGDEITVDDCFDETPA